MDGTHTTILFSSYALLISRHYFPVGAASITPSVHHPMLGLSNYTLTCRVTIIGNFCPTITYQWMKNNGTAIQLGTTSNTLSLSPLRLSDAGQYTCNVTISSPSLSSDVTIIASHNIRLRSKSNSTRILQPPIISFNTCMHAVPGPTNIKFSSSTPNPVRPIGSAVTLTCTEHVELNPVVDAPVISVNIVVTPWAWGELRDGVSVTESSQPVVGGTTAYTFTAMISSFGRNQSGLFGCFATLHSALNNTYIRSSYISLIYIVKVTTGEIFNIISSWTNIHLNYYYRCLFSIGKSIHC